MAARPFDLVLFGVTGFTGRLVAESLARAVPPGFRIALAGRSAAKVESVRESLPEPARAWPTLLADSADTASLDAMARSTRVVCTTVGPYAKHGLPLVGACARAGTSYCDLTGEVQFMRASIDAWDAAARESGARIVHACGFDSVPSDLGVLSLHGVLGPMTRATLVVEVLRGGFSGGTVASMLTMFEQAESDRAVRRLLADPWALSPDRAREPDLGPQPDFHGVQWDDFAHSWTAPFLMASANTRVVRRSNALLGHAWGAKLRYREVTAVKGPAGMAFGWGMAAGLATVTLLASRKLTRRFLGSVLPAPGEGPDEASRRNGRVRIRVLGEGENGRRASVRIEGEGDPGYQLTSTMLAQAALCLALDGEALPKAGGVLTPATAMGATLVQRLDAAGLRFTVAA